MTGFFRFFFGGTAAMLEEASRNEALLTSWKDIAKYVGKGVRTVQRWERDIGLPVRRPKRGTKSMVLAFPEEINNWAKSAKADRPAPETREVLLKRIEELELEVAKLKRQLEENRGAELSA